MPRVRGTPPRVILPTDLVAGVDPGAATAVVFTRGGRLISHEFVDTSGSKSEIAARLNERIAPLAPDVIVVERQFRNRRMQDIEMAMVTIAVLIGAKLVMHTPANLHRVSKAYRAGSGHAANKKASVALLRRVMGSEADAFLESIPGTRKHDVVEALLMMWLHSGVLDTIE